MNELRIRHLGQVDFTRTWERMRQFTTTRQADTEDELWLLQHEAVFTLGQAGRPEHVHHVGAIPLVATDRGGQVTYHAPGQWVAYPLIDLRRRKLHVRQLVDLLEDVLIATLNDFAVHGERRAHAPGIYVQGRKIASLGLRIRQGCSYHGLALNVAMDMQPWQGIDPCGMSGLAMTSLQIETRRQDSAVLMDEALDRLQHHFEKALCYNPPLPCADIPS